MENSNVEASTQHTMISSDTLKDLKQQLYSAAEYFEHSYNERDQKDMTLESLKDYVVKALVNTIDNVGLVAWKASHSCQENIEETSSLELQFSCLEQRMKLCQDFIQRNGITEQSLMLNYPRHHKRYFFTGDTMDGANRFMPLEGSRTDANHPKYSKKEASTRESFRRSYSDRPANPPPPWFSLNPCGVLDYESLSYDSSGGREKTALRRRASDAGRYAATTKRFFKALVDKAYTKHADV